MYKLQNGFTKKSMLEQIKKYNNGTKCEEDGGCLYTNFDYTNRCLIGCFIPDNHEGLHRSEKDALGLLNAYPDLEKFMPLDRHGLNDLQMEHDYRMNPSNIYKDAEKWINGFVKE